MKKYYMQVYKRPEAPPTMCDMVMLDKLPYAAPMMERLSALGVIDIRDSMLPVDQIDRVAKILRLRQSLGVNLAGVVIICDLLDRLESIEEEMRRQRRL